MTLPTTTAPPAIPSLKPVNDIPLTRTLLKQLLSDLSERLYRSFRRQVRLVVHGGAVMVLHPSFTHRDSTQDVDYIHRSFVKEYRALGFTDAEQRLRGCIAETAYRFNLGADWMNDHADVALPLALDQQGSKYDPIFFDATQHQSSSPLTIFSERGLALVAVPWPWAVALKLVRYAKKDPDDCGAILRLGSLQRGYRWTVDVLERWLSERCWPMRYSDYPPQRKAQLRERLKDALARAFPASQPQPQLPLMTTYQMYQTHVAQTQQMQNQTQPQPRTHTQQSSSAPRRPCRPCRRCRPRRPATAQFDVVALVIVVVLAAVAAMAASEEQQSPVYFF
ncbi:hypothetical protein BGY98DRAFT_922408 [Russula aff. rugulosa BPL654]|nr:hypothetical protein BGY98DRAFT_922408 [Russula aff. rugulosa BPL654]